jgi:hypothetical protein
LTDTEIKRICHPLVQSAAQIRYLRSLGVHVERKPGGRPLVSRAHFESVIAGRQASSPYTAPQDGQPGPDPAALAAFFNSRKKHGSQAQR